MAVHNAVDEAYGYVVHDRNGIWPRVCEIRIAAGRIDIRKVRSGICVWRNPNCREHDGLCQFHIGKLVARTCYRAHVGEIWCAGKCQREVGAVGEKDEHDGIRWQKQRPFAVFWKMARVFVVTRACNTNCGETEIHG